MDKLQAWSAALCLAALGCAAVQLLVPKNGTGRLVHLLVSTFFLCCLLSPLLSLPTWRGLDLEGLPDSVQAELLQETVLRQLEEQVQRTARTVTEQALAERGVAAEKIEVFTDISAADGIYMQRIVVTVDKQTVPIAKLAGEVIAAQLGTTVIIEAE